MKMVTIDIQEIPHELFFGILRAWAEGNFFRLEGHPAMISNQQVIVTYSDRKRYRIFAAVTPIP